MRYRLLLLLAVVVACVSLASTGRHLTFRYDIPPAHAHLQASSASYLGVFERGVPPNYEPVADFGQAVGQQPNLVGYYSGWVQPFPSSFAQKLYRHHMIMYIQIDPAYAHLSDIAAGIEDQYLSAYADSVRAFGRAVVIGFGHEMNAPWYSWGYHQTRSRTFVAAWRHVVTLFRQQGADNVTWLWTVNQDTPKTGPVARWWPGAEYVTWIGIDGYYLQPNDSFNKVFGHTIRQVRKFTTKPVLLSEVAVAPQANPSAEIPDLFQGMAKSKALGLVWFDMNQDKGVLSEDWHIADNTPAKNTFSLYAKGLNLITPGN
jgi:mannan endo-1,4-beta-mannosidase